MRARIRNLVLFGAALVVVIISAYGVGRVAASYLAHDTNPHYLSARSYSTGELVDKMKTIRTGSLFPDQVLRTLEGNSVRLSEVLNKRTCILFLDPGCPPCLNQVELIGRLAANDEQANRFVIISRTELSQLLKMKSEMNIKCRILWDSAGVFHEALKIHSSPFSVVVDERRIIELIVVGEFLEDEIIRIAQYD